MASASSGVREKAGKILVKMCTKHPDMVPEVRGGLEKLNKNIQNWDFDLKTRIEIGIRRVTLFVPPQTQPVAFVPPPTQTGTTTQPLSALDLRAAAQARMEGRE